jgi:hypothetical protein
MQFPLPNWVVNIGQDAQWNVNKHRICKFLSCRPLKSVNTWNQSPFWNALSREFSCRWRHLSCKLRPEIDNGFTFTLIKTTMRFKQIRKYIYSFWCQNGAILLLPFWLNNQSQIFPEKHSPYWIICISCVCLHSTAHLDLYLQLNWATEIALFSFWN